MGRRNQVVSGGLGESPAFEAWRRHGRVSTAGRSPQGVPRNCWRPVRIALVEVYGAAATGCTSHRTPVWRSRWLPRSVETSQPRLSGATRRTYSLASSPIAVSAGPRDSGPAESTTASQWAVVGGEREPIGGGDHSGIAAGGDPVGRDVLPLPAQLVRAPVAPGPAAVGRETPSVAHCPVPDLAPRPERHGVHVVPGKRRRLRVVANDLPGL